MTKPKASARSSLSRDPGPEVLRDLHGKGMSRREIAVHLGVTVPSVSSYFQKHRIRTDFRVNDHPSRRQLREAVKASRTKESAADRLGISMSMFDKLCAHHGIKGVGASGKSSSRTHMSRQMRAGTAEAQALKAGYTKIVGTDALAMIEAAVAAGQVTRCPPAFAEFTAQAQPLSDDDRERLRLHQDRLGDAA